MDRNTIIGLTLIFLLLLLWQQFVTPSAEEVERQRRAQDSLARLETLRDKAERIAEDPQTFTPSDSVLSPETDSLLALRLSGAYGPYASAASGEEQLEILENDLFRVTFSNKGGRIVEVELKEHYKISEDERKQEIKSPLRLLEDEKNKFEYLLPAANVAAGAVSTADLFFEAEKSENAIVFRARAANGGFFEQRYVIQPGSYLIDYSVRVSNMEGVIPPGADAIRLNWVNYLDRLEKNTNYERQYSTIYFKTLENGVDYTSATRNTQKEVGKALRWISHSNQFFNSTLIAQDRFQSANLEVQVFDLDNEDLKRLRTILSIPYDQVSSGAFAMQWYVGPNEFSRLREIGARVEDIIPFGWSIFGTINRWVIRPLFNFLSNFIPSKGLVILALTLIVKMLLFPLTYRMLYSQSKMAALKPQLERLREKHKDDPQQQQLEQMKIYREFGVNPLGGCMPMLLQMPIWFALYRFFPAAFEFRQAGFLWATDLSSYDVFARLPFEIPFGFGAHVSLFTLLWALTTLLYTWYNMRHIDMGGMAANPALKYMQYIMPILFMGFFNSFASGLTAYLLFSNLVNIGQTVVTKNFIIDQEKIKRELEAYRKKPKKKGGFQQRLEAALKEQQRIQSERDAAAKKKRKT